MAKKGSSKKKSLPFELYAGHLDYHLPRPEIHGRDPENDLKKSNTEAW